MGAGREPAWAVLAWKPWRPAFCSPFFTGCPVFPSLGAVMGPAICPWLYRAHPFVAGMHQALSGPVNSPTGFREPCRLGSGFGNWTKCFKAPASQHLLKTQTLLFFLTEVSYSGFRILPCVSPQSCLFFLISVPTTQVPGTVLSLLGGGSGFPACPPFILSFFSVASSMRASQQPRGMAVSQGVSYFRASFCFPLHAEHNPASLAWPQASDPGLRGAFPPFPSPPLVLALLPPSPAPAAPGFWHPRASPVQGLNLLLPFSASSFSSPPPSLLAVPRAV